MNYFNEARYRGTQISFKESYWIRPGVEMLLSSCEIC